MASSSAPSSPSLSCQRLSNVPDFLRIKILFSDDSIIVIHKPSLLRSVPGHASTSTRSSNNRSSPSGILGCDAQRNNTDIFKSGKRRRHRTEDSVDIVGSAGNVDIVGNVNIIDSADNIGRSSDDEPNSKALKTTEPSVLPRKYKSSGKNVAQSLWIEAIHNWGEIEEINCQTYLTGNNQADINAQIILSNLAMKQKSSLSSVPRKYPSFKRYCQRNIMSLLPHLFQNYDYHSKVGNGNGDSYDNGKDNKNNNGNGYTNKKHVVQHDTQLQSVIEEASKVAHGLIIRKQRETNELLSKNQKHQPLQPRGSSREEDSAFGQLKLLMKIGYERNENKNRNVISGTYSYGERLLLINKNKDKDNRYHQSDIDIDIDIEIDRIRVVHRLDCETSGVMVFARNEQIASILSKSWRERDKVSKTYVAKVKRWDPYKNNRNDDGQHEGIINFALSPIKDERLKWQVQDESDGGKPSCTMWRVLSQPDIENKINSGTTWSTQLSASSETNDSDDDNGLFLELKPITGRTHQLRVHCAAMGSGIANDSLYGDNPTGIDLDMIDELPKEHLKLHAQKLSFPHPSTKKKVEFVSSLIDWFPDDLL